MSSLKICPYQILNVSQ